MSTKGADASDTLRTSRRWDEASSRSERHVKKIIESRLEQEKVNQVES